MQLNELQHKHRDFILALAAEHGLSNLRVFGSVARGEAGPESDLDLLAYIPRGFTLFDLCRFERLAEERLGIPVQLVADDAIHPLVADAILKDARPL